MRVIIDANVVVSFLLSKGDTVSFIFDAWENETFEVLTSLDILTELDDVIDRAVRVTKEGVDPMIAVAMKRRLRKNTTRIPVVSIVSTSKDKKDNRYLACAKDGAADYLITGDKKHLLSLKKYGTTRIVSPKEFVEVVQKSI
ncbi:putative toxin-antitoxin system toxin component, PIN family [Candidatus Gottesmanbacteria bacterium]|nr:putative toxin-antitoxin system toxin component, PIN family [Candidatus Gottesmanbacteria bacterium]